MENIDKNEDLSICSECGGMCCKKSGCDYSLTDFSDLKYQTMLNELNKGDKSIVAMISFRTLHNGKLIAEPFMYIRARNVNRDIVDLISMKTRCSQLGENGCKYDYEHRPLGGRNLKPSRSKDGPCRPVISPIWIMETWKPYQKQLSKLVKYYTGMSVDKKIKIDVENLIYDVMMENFEGVLSLELADLKGFVPLLVRAFPEQAMKAKERFEKNSFKVLSKKNK